MWRSTRHLIPTFLGIGVAAAVPIGGCGDGASAHVSSRRERVEVPFRRFRRVLLIKETEPIEPELLDYKFYAKGVGPVLGVEMSGGSDRQELVSLRRRPR
jgi:hypothetical protein